MYWTRRTQVFQKHLPGVFLWQLKILFTWVTLTLQLMSNTFHFNMIFICETFYTYIHRKASVKCVIYTIEYVQLYIGGTIHDVCILQIH